MIYMYVHFPYNNIRNGIVNLFKTEEKVNSFALQQMKDYTDRFLSYGIETEASEHLKVVDSFIKSKDPKRAIEEYEKYLKSLGQESALHEIRAINII